jgi:Holliday junction resolvasome RuvABC endonuclease subunit
MRVLGLDPSSQATGFGLIESRDGEATPVRISSSLPGSSSLREGLMAP